MKVEKIGLEQTGQFSHIFLDYIHCKEALKPFYQDYPGINNFQGFIDRKEFSKEKRVTLVKALQEQYVGQIIPEEVQNNIHALNYEKTFTVTTGHQLNIFTGPLYFIYKIVSTINLAKKLKEAYPDYHFVPVYWMASEDHDFAEINNFNLFGKKYVWETDQKGAVGKFRPQSLSQIIGELPESVEIFEQAYLDSATLADAVRNYVTRLFGQQGLVVIDGDHKDLKAEFKSVIKDDFLNHTANHFTEETSEKLNALGYQAQVYPRAINFFYVNSAHRDRFVKVDDHYEVLNTDKKFNKEQLLALIDEQPDHFSPNVILRPLYQEMILPNLAYLGGPSEVAYWLQLKPVFDHYKTPFPALVPRNFALYFNPTVMKKFHKLHFKLADVFRPQNELKEIQLKADSDNEIALEEEKARLQEVFQSIEDKTLAIDKSLKGFIGSMQSKIFKDIENIEKKLKKAEEKNHDAAMSKIDSIKEKLFPGGTPQERHDNFLTFYLNDKDFIHKLLTIFDPLDFHYLLLSEESIQKD